VGAVLEQRHGDAPHAAARGDGGLDGAGAGGARHAGDAHVRLRRGALLRARCTQRRQPHLLVVRVEQRDILHLVAATARRRRPGAGAGDRRELQVGHARQAQGREGAAWGGNIWWEGGELRGGGVSL